MNFYGCGFGLISIVVGLGENFVVEYLGQFLWLWVGVHFCGCGFGCNFVVVILGEYLLL